MVKVYVPRENVNDESVTIAQIFYETGSKVESGNIILQIETSKTIVDISAPITGIIQHNLYNGLNCLVGSLLFSIFESQDLIVGLNSPRQITSNELQSKNLDCILSNAAKVYFDNNKLINDDMRLNGWVTSKKLKELDQKTTSDLHTIASEDVELDASEPPLNEKFHSRKIDKRKEAEINALEVGNCHAITSTIGVNIECSLKRLTSVPALFEENIADIIIYEASRLLVIYPDLNTFYDSGNIFYYKDINFGWSIDANNIGLKVLSIKNANQKTLTQIQEEILFLLELYSSQKTIPLEYLNSSTVTLTDLSGMQLSFMQPLLNGRQSIIIGVISPKANVISFYATFDHRVVSGRYVGEFLNELKNRFQTYFLPTDF
jgi:pyruvate dehydrogenase E2 component (dihydrolipoamide acetyltransferase)